ncbi:MAG: tetratricopeptide repeat protein [Reichenbachiella sp.]|uniref:transcriptional regulator n=1 Tax=Reichenbachiella sp. TaxID=2184521 RepID=UPI003264318D
MRIAIFLVLFVLPITLFAQLDSLISVSDTIHNPNERVLWLLKTGFMNYHDDPTLAEQLALKSMKIAKKESFEDGIARSHHILGIVYWSTGRYQQSLEHNFEAKRIYEELGDDRRVMLIEVNNSNVYGELNDHRTTIMNLKSVNRRAALLQDSQILKMTYTNMAPEFRKLDQYDSSLYYSKKGLAYSYALQDTSSILGNLTNISSALNHQSKIEESIDYSKKARELIKHKSNKKRLIATQVNMAESYHRLGQLDIMKLYMDSALVVAVEIEDMYLQRELYTGLWTYYSELEDFENALNSHEKLGILNDSISNVEIRKEVKNLQLQYEDEKKQKQIAQLEKWKALDSLKFNSILFGMIVIVLGGGLFIYRQKLKIIQATNREISLNNRLDKKTQELTAYALNFIQKNELMNDMTKKINELIAKSDTGISKELNRLNGIIKSSFRLDHDWENFKLMFEEIHSGFFMRLKSSYPELGNAELKLCALMRLNMNLKEASSVLGISTNSVKTARHRIRKKFGLSTEDNLTDFLINFDFESQQLPPDDFEKLV